LKSALLQAITGFRFDTWSKFQLQEPWLSSRLSR